MTKIRIQFASWCNDDKHDKVWGYFTVGDTPGRTIFVFWGARNKSLQIKFLKGYKQLDVKQFEEIFPGFYQEVDNKLTFAILSGNKYKAAT